MSSCSGRMPVSMTATTTDGLPVVRSQALWRDAPRRAALLVAVVEVVPLQRVARVVGGRIGNPQDVIRLSIFHIGPGIQLAGYLEGLVAQPG